jgi:hypothetical protein
MAIIDPSEAMKLLHTKRPDDSGDDEVVMSMKELIDTVKSTENKLKIIRQDISLARRDQSNSIKSVKGYVEEAQNTINKKLDKSEKKSVSDNKETHERLLELTHKIESAIGSKGEISESTEDIKEKLEEIYDGLSTKTDSIIHALNIIPEDLKNSIESLRDAIIVGAEMASNKMAETSSIQTETLSSAISASTESITKDSQSKYQETKEMLKSVGNKVSDGFKYVFSLPGMLIDQIASLTLKKVASFMRNKIFVPVVAAIWSGVAAIIGWINAYIVTPILLPLLAIGGLIFLFFMVFSETFRSYVTELVQNIWSYVEPYLGPVVEWIANAAIHVMEYLSEWWFNDVMQGKSWSEFLSDVWYSFSTAIGPFLWDVLLESSTNLGIFFRQMWDYFWELDETWRTMFGEWLRDIPYVGPVFDAIMNFMDWVSNTLEPWIEWVQEGIDQIIQYVLPEDVASEYSSLRESGASRYYSATAAIGQAVGLRQSRDELDALSSDGGLSNIRLAQSIFAQDYRDVRMLVGILRNEDRDSVLDEIRSVYNQTQQSPRELNTRWEWFTEQDWNSPRMRNAIFDALTVDFRSSNAGLHQTDDYYKAVFGIDFNQPGPRFLQEFDALRDYLRNAPETSATVNEVYTEINEAADGMIVRVAEAGDDEAIIPLNKRGAKFIADTISKLLPQVDLPSVNLKEEEHESLDRKFDELGSYVQAMGNKIVSAIAGMGGGKRDADMSKFDEQIQLNKMLSQGKLNGRGGSI